MRFSLGQVGRTLVCVLALVSGAAVARAQTVCTAAEVSGADSGCPSNGDECRITKGLSVTDGCTLDFGQRDLTITQSGRLIVRTGAMTIRARNLTINTGGLLDGRGPLATDTGGIINISVTGGVNIQGPNGAIDVSADDGGGTIMIEAAAAISISGRLRAVGNIRFGSGGNIVLRSDTDISTTLSSQVVATGAREGGVGGLIDITGRGRLDLGAVLDVDGSDGGEVNLFSGQDMAVRAVEARGTSDAGSGGCVGMQAEAGLQLLDVVSLNGTGSSQGSGGGCGGFACFEARYGDLIVRSDITAEGAIPDGGGGSIALIADAGSIILQPDKLISVRGNGRQGCGGEICADASISVDAQSLFDSSGGLAGGDVDLSAGKDITIGHGIDARGRGIGSCAGTMLIEAGFEAVGSVQVASAINVSSGGCGVDLGCGIGGLSQIIGCRVAVTQAGSVDVQAGQGGQIELIARAQLTVQGPLTATKSSNDPEARDGTVELRHPIGIAPVVGAAVRPLPMIVPAPLCTAQRGVDCLLPCPACGNSVVEFPEGCDNGGGANPVSCDGCSTRCQVENCDDGFNCTIDSCQPQRGCRHAPVELPSTPCYEPSEATPTATRTVSPTASVTGTRTATPTRTGPAPTNTRTGPVPTNTRTGPVPTNTRTPTLIGVPTATPTVGGTVAPSDCTGDCDNSGLVSVNELVRGVNILLGSQQLSGCPSFDRNASGTVTVDELVTAVRIVLEDGCP